MSSHFQIGSHATAKTSPLPADVATWALTKILFQDSMTDPNTFDLANTLDASKNWFIKNTWTGSPDFAGELIATDPANLKIDHNGTRILASANALGINWDFATAADNGSGGHVGRTFKPPFYISFETLINPGDATADLATNPVSAFWLESIRLLTNVISDGGLYSEKDLHEGIVVSGPSMVDYSNLFEWTVESGIETDGNEITNRSIATATTSLWTKREVMIIPSSLNDGVGFQKIWLNGIHLSANDVSWGPSQHVSPGVTGTNTNGTLMTTDTEEYVLIAGTSADAYYALRNVLVLGAP